jgi:hypothetical protein
MYTALGSTENSLDLSSGLRFGVVPEIVSFIDLVPAAAVLESHVHEPPVPPLHDQDVGAVLPLSNDPFGAMLEADGGSSRYTNPDNIEEEACSVALN